MCKWRRLVSLPHCLSISSDFAYSNMQQALTRSLWVGVYWKHMQRQAHTICRYAHQYTCGDWLSTRQSSGTYEMKMGELSSQVHEDLRLKEAMREALENWVWVCTCGEHEVFQQTWNRPAMWTCVWRGIQPSPVWCSVLGTFKPTLMPTTLSFKSRAGETFK